MKWRVLLELTDANGTVETRELVMGHRLANAMSPASIGLSLAEGKTVLAAVQAELVQARVDEYCQQLSMSCATSGLRV